MHEKTLLAEKKEAAQKTISLSKAVGHAGDLASFGDSSQFYAHHVAGNLAVQRMLQTGASQAKPGVSQPAAPDEQEAEYVAEQPMSVEPLAMIQRQCAACSEGTMCPQCEEERIQPKEKPGQRPHVSTNVISQIASLRGGGQPLPPAVRAFFEPWLGRDFSQVRVHTDGPAADTAQTISARAYTTGHDVVFGAGNYAPDTDVGRKLLAHELTHVVQQRAGVQLDGGVGEVGDCYEQQADAVADTVASGRDTEPLLDEVAGSRGTTAAAASAIMQPTPAVQRDSNEEHATETKDQFAMRVREHAATRLIQNIGVLGQWSSYVSAMEDFQLRAQLLTQVATSFATTAQPTASGRSRFEEWAGTYNPALRTWRGSEFDVESTYRERSNNFMAYLESMSVTGYNTTPSVAENLQVLAGDRSAQNLPPSVHVGPALQYSEYADTIRRYRSHQIGGCQTCHEINLAWQRTAERWGSPLPRGDLLSTNALAGGETRQQQSLLPFSASEFSSPRDREALLAFMQSSPTTTPTSQPTGPPQPLAISPPQAQPDPTTGVPQNPFLPTVAIPEGVTIPPPRTDLCGALPAAEDSDRQLSLDSWGPSSAIVASVVSRIGSVLTPLGPRGYRVLPRQDFDALYAVSPDNMQSVRDRIIERINDRRQQYTNLRADIQRGGVPYEELCPIVDELLPSTNALVRYQALEDVHAWQRREKLLTFLELILLGLTIIFPPAAALTIPVGLLLGLARGGLGLTQQRQGRQWVQGTGSGIYSLSQEAEAPGLAERGRSNIISGAVSFGFSAFAFTRILLEARASAQLLQALEAGAIIRHAEYPGVALLARNGRLLMVTETGEVLGYGMIQNGKLWFTRFETPFNPFGGPSGYGGGTGGTSIVPYGSSAIVPYGSTQFGGSSLVPYGGTGLTLPTIGQGTPLLLTGPPSPLLLTAGRSPLLLTAGQIGPVVDPGGRGLFTLPEQQIARLSAADAARLRDLQRRIPVSAAELADLVALRRSAAGVELPEVAGTPEHMLARWHQYSGPPRNGSMSFQQWAAGHPSRMANSVAGPAAEMSYRVALANAGVASRSAVVKTATGQTRQVDVLIEGGRGQARNLIQIKAGKEPLTTVPRQSGGASLGSASLSNEAALVADSELIAAGDRVTWVFEKLPSGPLIARARQLGVDVIIRVPDAAGRTRMIELMRRAGMSEAEINNVTFVEGTIDDVVAFVARRFGVR